jgi:hypothetical protein
MEVAKKIVGTSIRLLKMSVRTLWRVGPFRKEKEIANNSVRAIEVGELTTLGSFACTGRKKDDGDTSGPTCTL